MENLIISLGEISLASSIVILILMIISPFLNRRYTAKWRYWVWLIVAVRLIIPFNISMPVKIFEPSLNNSVYQTKKAEITDIEKPFISETISDQNITEEEIIRYNNEVREYNETVNEINKGSFSLFEIVIAVWLFGMTLTGAWELSAYLHLKRGIKRWKTAPEDRIKNIFIEKLKSMNLSEKVNIFICPKVSSPMVAGIFKPTVLLPKTDYSDKELEFILTHELVHYRRKDIIYKAILLFANVVNWFNPLVWLMRKEAEKDVEISCDDEVIKLLGKENRQSYAETVLNCAKNQPKLSTAFTTSFYSSKDVLKKRFINIFDKNLKKQGKKAFALILVTVIIGSGFVGCRVADEDANDLTILPEINLDSFKKNAEQFLDIMSEDREEKRLSHFPKQTGPDENGKFPIIPYELYEKYIDGREGKADKEKPKNLHDWRNSECLKSSIEATYPNISDWQLVFEKSDYRLENCYDPYNYIFREWYLPTTTLVLSTNQSDKFDRLVVNLAEQYHLIYEDEGMQPEKSEYVGFCQGKSDEWGEIKDFSQAEVADYGSTFWFPKENKAILCDEAMNISIAVENIKEKQDFTDLRIYTVKSTLPKADVNEKDCLVSSTYAYENGQEKNKVYYYKSEDKSLKLYEDIHSNYPRAVNDNVILFQQKNEILFYDVSAEDPTVPMFVVGDKGRGFEGKDIKIEVLISAQNNKNEFVTIYRENDDWWTATFDVKGNIHTNYKLDIKMAELYEHEVAYDGGRIYIDNMILNDNYNFSSNTKDGGDHSCKLFMVERNFLDYNNYLNQIKPLYYPLVSGMTFAGVEEIECWREIAERIIDIEITDPKENFWTKYPEGKIHIDEMMNYINMYFDVDKETVVKKVKPYMQGDWVQYHPHRDFVPDLVWSDNYHKEIIWNGDMGTMRYSRINSETRKPYHGYTFEIKVKYDPEAPQGFKYVSMQKTEPQSNY